MLPTWVPSILQRVPGAQNRYRVLLYATRKTVKNHMVLFPFLWNLVGTWQKKEGNITGKIWHYHNSIPPLSSSQFPSLPHLQLDLETTNWLKGSLSYSPSFQFGILAVASLTILTNVTTVSGTPGGGMGKFLGGAPVVKERLSKRHSPIVPYVNLPCML